MNKLVMHPASTSLSFQRITNIMTSSYTFIPWAAIPCSSSRMRPSWPRPRVRLNPSLTYTYLVSRLFVLAHPVACSLFQWFIFHMHNPPFTTRRFNTFIQVNNMGAWCNIYNRHIHILQIFFLCFFLTSGLAGWPQTFKSGTLPGILYTISLESYTLGLT
jgi:hypothetical protein